MFGKVGHPAVDGAACRFFANRARPHLIERVVAPSAEANTHWLSLHTPRVFMAQAQMLRLNLSIMISTLIW